MFFLCVDGYVVAQEGLWFVLVRIGQGPCPIPVPTCEARVLMDGWRNEGWGGERQAMPRVFVRHNAGDGPREGNMSGVFPAVSSRPLSERLHTRGWGRK